MARLRPDQVHTLAKEASDIVVTAMGATAPGSVDYELLALRAVSTVAHRHGVRVKPKDLTAILKAMLAAWALTGAMLATD